MEENSDDSALAELMNENDSLKEKSRKLAELCQRLEQDSEDLELLLNEQSELMKVLNVRSEYFTFIIHCLISSVLCLIAEKV